MPAPLIAVAAKAGGGAAAKAGGGAALKGGGAKAAASKGSLRQSFGKAKQGYKAAKQIHNATKKKDNNQEDSFVEKIKCCMKSLGDHTPQGMGIGKGLIEGVKKGVQEAREMLHDTGPEPAPAPSRPSMGSRPKAPGMKM